jgi:hypothetical protein
VIEAIDGFPFMMQLVGYHAWENCTSGVMQHDDFANGIALANRDMKNEVLAASWKSASAKDREFLAAMAVSEAPVTLTGLAERLGVSNSYAGQYKYRRLEQGLIEEPSVGELNFALPALREFVLEHAARGGLL